MFKVQLFQYWGIVVVVVFWGAVLGANLLCREALPHKLKYFPNDFAQYYMGAVAARYGMPDCLYPESNGTSLFLTGIVKSPLSEKLKSKEWKRSTVFIYPPPLALLFIPFTFLQYPTASYLFTACNALAVALTFLFFYRECSRYKINQHLCNLFILFAGISMPLIYGILVANSSPMIMLAAAVVLYGIRNNWPGLTGCAFVFAAITKGLSAPWAILLILMKKWRTVFYGAFLSSAMLLVSIAVFGVAPHLDFFHRIIPESRYLYWIGDGNLGFPSLVAFLTTKTVSQPMAGILDAIQIGLYLFIYFLVSCSKNKNLNTWYLSMFLCILIMQLFSPVFWVHHFLIILPFFPFGWARSRGLIQALYMSGWALVWFPIGNAMKYLTNSELWGFGRTLGYVLLAIWALRELWQHAFHEGEENADSRPIEIG